MDVCSLVLITIATILDGQASVEKCCDGCPMKPQRLNKVEYV